MLHDIAFALWFLLPAATANMAPILSAAIPGLKRWDTPIDGGRTLNGKQLLGSHKTWRGLVSGIVVATLVLWLQQLLATHASWATYMTANVNYAALPVLLLGPLFAIGALGGDALESFFKRQQGIRSGGSWVPFDQIDYIIGAIVASLPIVVATTAQYLWMLGIWFAMHLAFSYFGWKLGLKDQPI